MVLALAAIVVGRRRILIISASLACVSTLALAFALLTGDFSIEDVVATTSLATPWPYRIAALWGGMDGSMLFYSALSGVAAAVGLRRSPEVRVGAAVALGLMAITMFFANPFFVPDLPAVDGEGLLAEVPHHGGVVTGWGELTAR